VTTAPQTKQNLRKQNHQLEKNVRHALSKTTNLDSAAIVVLARNGAITLDGSGFGSEQIQLAANTAASVSGVGERRRFS
jgi:hyperosmotically inducible periplasmic protein